MCNNCIPVYIYLCIESPLVKKILYIWGRPRALKLFITFVKLKELTHHLVFSDVCHRGCTYTVLQTVQCAVLSMVLCTIKNSLSQSIGVGHNSDLGFFLSRYRHECVENDVKQHSLTHSLHYQPIRHNWLGFILINFKIDLTLRILIFRIPYPSLISIGKVWIYLNFYKRNDRKLNIFSLEQLSCVLNFLIEINLR